jgi:CIC family chloride channel protein
MLVELLHYAILSLLCAGVAYLFVKGLQLIEKRTFHHLPAPLPRVTKPALGGLAMGLLVMALMIAVGSVPVAPNLVLGASRPDHLMTGGHRYLQTVVDGALDPALYDFWTSFKVAGFLGVVVIAKIVATGLTLGSGGSGGLLFPALFLGGVTGAAYSKLLRAFTAADWVPGIMVMSPNERAGMILVGMGGIFAACTKTPITSLVMVSEITGSYGLSVPLMMTCASAYLLSHSFTMNEEQVAGIADSPAHRGEFLVNVLQDLNVADAVPKSGPVDTIPEDTPYPQVLEKIRGSSATVFPISIFRASADCWP